MVRKIKHIDFTGELSCFIASLHEQKQLGHVVCYEAAICYHVEWCEYECCRLLIFINLFEHRMLSYMNNRTPHMLTCTLS